MTPKPLPRLVKNRKSKLSEKELFDALHLISLMGHGMKPEVIDWANIGKNAVHKAKEVLRGKCPECGK